MTLAAVTIALCTLGLAALLGAAPQDPADDRGWQLTWRAPSGCPDAASVERRFAGVLGASARDASLRVSAVVKRDGAGWTLDLVARRAGGRQRRRLHHRDCATLVEATLLLVALAVDPGAAVDPRLAAALRSAQPASAPRRPPAPDGPAAPVADAAAPAAETVAPVGPVADAPASRVAAETVAPVVPPAPAAAETVAPVVPPAPAAAETVAPVVPPAPPVVVEAVAPPPMPAPPPARDATSTVAPGPTPPPRRRPMLALRVGGGVAAGATPAVSGGLVGAFAVAPGPRARIELTGSYWAPRRTHLAGAAGPGADISLAVGGARGCGVVARGRFELPLCLGAELGGMQATGVDVAGARRVRSLWLALTPGVAAVLAVHPRLALWLGVDGLLALVRPQFVIDNGGEVHRAGRVGVRGWLGLEVRFPPIGAPRP